MIEGTRRGWIVLSETLIGRSSLVHLSGDVEVISSVDRSPLGRGEPISQLVCVDHVLRGLSCLAQIVVDGSKSTVGHSEVRVDFDGLFEKGKRCEITFCVP